MPIRLHSGLIPRSLDIHGPALAPPKVEVGRVAPADRFKAAPEPLMVPAVERQAVADKPIPHSTEDSESEQNNSTAHTFAALPILFEYFMRSEQLWETAANLGWYSPQLMALGLTLYVANRVVHDKFIDKFLVESDQAMEPRTVRKYTMTAAVAIGALMFISNVLGDA